MIIQRSLIGNPIPIVSRGASLEFIIDRDGESTTGWTCNISVLRYVGAPVEVSTEATRGLNDQWEGLIYPAETEALTDTGLYRLVAVLSNSGTGQEEVQVYRFHLTDSWV